MKNILYAFRHGFRARVFWYITSIVIGISVFFTAVVIYQQEKLLKQDLINKGISVVRNLAHDSELGVFTESRDFLEPVIMQSVRYESNVLYAAIYNLNGKPLSVHTDVKGWTAGISEDIKRELGERNGPFWQKSVFDKDTIYDFWATVVASKEFKREEDMIFQDTKGDENNSTSNIKKPLVRQAYDEQAKRGKTIGMVQMGFSLKGINARIKEIIWTSVSITVLFLPAAFILTYVLSQRLAKPLLLLKNGVEGIEKGGWYERIDLNSRDEIGELASSFNRMVDAIKNRDEKVMRHVKELSALNLVTSAVNQSLDLKTILECAIKEVLKITGMEAGWVYLSSGDKGLFNITAYEGVDDKFVQSIDSLKPGEGIAGRVILSGKPIIADDITGDTRISRGEVWEEGFRAFASIPLKTREDAIGAMNITSRSVHPFTSDEIELLYSIGNEIGTAVENSMLYEKVKRQLEEIERGQEKLIRTARLASLGELAANVAHEVNNPLTGILGYTSLMRDDMPDTNPDKEKLNVIFNETMRIKNIVRNLLDFARQREPKMDKTCIVDVLKDTLNLVSHLAKVSNVQIVEEYIDNPPLVSVDVQQMKQVFLNLFNNAIYVMPKGGSMKVMVSKEAEWVNVSIHDSGGGIPKDIIHKIFDPFFTTKPQAKGTGLGLSISHGIVERHGGTIGVESEIDRGSIFTVKLPAVDETKGNAE
ncbi:MAG: GAF domain-containing protein [Nitrospinae bacterium]|nr:GAF domain-containing protein [Nitrospinota bacterium]